MVEKKRGHAPPHPPPPGPDRLLAPASLGAGARPLWAGLRCWCRNLGGLTSPVQPGGQWLAMLLPRPLPCAQRVRRAGASEIQSLAEITRTQSGGHGGVPRVCGSRGFKPRAGCSLPEVCLGRWAGLARSFWPGVGVRRRPSDPPRGLKLLRRRLLRAGRGNLLSFLKLGEPPNAPFENQMTHFYELLKSQNFNWSRLPWVFPAYQVPGLKYWPPPQIAYTSNLVVERDR